MGVLRKQLKIRFLEPGNRPYRKSLMNWFVYDRYIRNPSNGMLTLATILHKDYEDVYCYSESVSKIRWEDVFDSDIVCISIFTFNANRGYDLAKIIREHSDACIVFGGLHATLNWEETMKYGDYVLLGEGDERILPLIKCIEEGRTPDFPGIVYHDVFSRPIFTGDPKLPRNIDTIPDRSLLYRFREITTHSTVWPQVHASRGCPHHCDYCALTAAFGSTVRIRTPEIVVEDIRQAIKFFDEGHLRLVKMLWITDDNFFADREWAVSVLNAIIESELEYKFTVQARYEVGFDDELLALLKKAGFIELAVGIEFLEDESFRRYHKKSNYSKVLQAIRNIKKHGLRVRGLFIVGADDHEPGVGDKIADFVLKEGIDGMLVQSMYFIPGTKVYETHRDKLIKPRDWSRCTGKVVHYPEHMSPADLQGEIIRASARVYSFPRFIHALLFKRGIDRILFLGEFFWQASVRKELVKDLEELQGKR